MYYGISLNLLPVYPALHPLSSAIPLEDLRRMREAKQKAMEMRDSANKDIQVIVGMGT